MAKQSLCWSCTRCRAWYFDEGGCEFHLLHPDTNGPLWIPEEVIYIEKRSRGHNNTPRSVKVKIVTKCSMYVRSIRDAIEIAEQERDTIKRRVETKAMKRAMGR